jgi:hypothetical protein
LSQRGWGILPPYIRSKYPGAFINETYMREDFPDMKRVRVHNVYMYLRDRAYTDDDLREDSEALPKNDDAELVHRAAKVNGDYLMWTRGVKNDYEPYAYRMLYRTPEEEYNYLLTWLDAREG